MNGTVQPTTSPTASPTRWYEVIPQDERTDLVVFLKCVLGISLVIMFGLCLNRMCKISKFIRLMFTLHKDNRPASEEPHGKPGGTAAVSDAALDDIKQNSIYIIGSDDDSSDDDGRKQDANSARVKPVQWGTTQEEKDRPRSPLQTIELHEISKRHPGSRL